MTRGLRLMPDCIFSKGLMTPTNDKEGGGIGERRMLRISVSHQLRPRPLTTEEVTRVFGGCTQAGYFA